MRKILPPKQTGLTLVEILVAMTVGLILMGGLIQIFLSNKQTYRTMESVSRLQENGRFSMTFLGKDIRKADYQGCRSRSNIPTQIAAKTAGTQALDASLYNDNDGVFTGMYNAANGAVTGLNNVVSGTTVGSDTVITGTDILTMQYAGSCNGHLVTDMNATQAGIKIPLSNSCELSTDRVFIISDCQSADILRTSGINTTGNGKVLLHRNSHNLNNHLSKAYRSDAEVFTMESVTYYVALNGNGTPSLYRRDHARNRTEELITDIDDFQVLYGEDTTGNDRVADQYLTANNVTDMLDVVSVRIQIRSRSKDDNISLAANTVTYNGSNVTDHRIRRQFSSTFSIRNRQF